MTNRELIRLLRKLPPELEIVFAYDVGRDGGCRHGRIVSDKPPAVMMTNCWCGANVIEIAEGG